VDVIYLNDRTNAERVETATPALTIATSNVLDMSTSLYPNDLLADSEGARRASIPIAIVIALVFVAIAATICWISRARARRQYDKSLIDTEGLGLSTSMNQRLETIWSSTSIPRQEDTYGYYTTSHARDARSSFAGTQDSNSTQPRRRESETFGRMSPPRPPLQCLQDQFSSLHVRLAQPDHPGFDPKWNGFNSGSSSGRARPLSLPPQSQRMLAFTPTGRPRRISPPHLDVVENMAGLQNHRFSYSSIELDRPDHQSQPMIPAPPVPRIRSEFTAVEWSSGPVPMYRRSLGDDRMFGLGMSSQYRASSPALVQS